ncbi:MAG: HNH endonuclease [Phycisphaerae bacterium]|nr:HNH endonuclease [Phycisphaerae bacterium]NUQ47710.1 HNH endonuclease [Phycisphaerae bacterium]
MAERIPWTRDQQLLALRLYMRLPFGRLHGRNPEIIALARCVGRTANALAMKACNFAGLDPQFRATNRRGLSGASDADRAIWSEFAGNPEQLAAEAEEAFARLDPAQAARDETGIRPPAGETDVARIVRARRVQSFFRAAVLTSYDFRCAVSGLAVPELLVASHIIPWSTSVERRADPRNGLCLNALFDRAFDRGLMTFDNDLRVIVSPRLHRTASDARLTCSLDRLRGQSLSVPDRFPPDPGAIKFHRKHIFQG